MGYPRSGTVLGFKGQRSRSQGARVQVHFHTNVRTPEHNAKTNDPKVIKLDIGNELGLQVVCFWVENLKGQRSRLGLELGLTLMSAA